MRVAVCLYGQPRTWAYCADYIKRSYAQREVGVTRMSGFRGLQPIYKHSVEMLEVDYFAHVKPYNFFNNVHSVRWQRHDVPQEELDRLLATFSPKRYLVDALDAEDELLRWPAWGYAGMMRSMAAVVLLKQEEELESGRLYDIVVFQRYDVVAREGQLHGCFNKTRDPLMLYTASNQEHRFWPEAWHAGGNDILMMCDSLTADLLVSYAVPVWNDVSYDTTQFWFPYGPNSFLSKASHHCNVLHGHVHLDLAVIRPDSDMSRPLEEAFDYHARTWHNPNPARPRE